MPLPAAAAEARRPHTPPPGAECHVIVGHRDHGALRLDFISQNESPLLAAMPRSHAHCVMCIQNTPAAKLPAGVDGLDIQGTHHPEMVQIITARIMVYFASPSHVYTALRHGFCVQVTLYTVKHRQFTCWRLYSNCSVSVTCTQKSRICL
jgi:hypothetical protein